MERSLSTPAWGRMRSHRCLLPFTCCQSAFVGQSGDRSQADRYPQPILSSLGMHFLRPWMGTPRHASNHRTYARLSGIPEISPNVRKSKAVHTLTS